MSNIDMDGIIPKTNDIIYYEDNLGDKYILYVKGEVKVLEGDSRYFMAKVSKTHCHAIDPTFTEFNRFTKTILIDNFAVQEMEIMNLTEKFPEYFV